jgi:hypothetical protein
MPGDERSVLRGEKKAKAFKTEKVEFPTILLFYETYRAISLFR